jgi:uncharacterized protein
MSGDTVPSYLWAIVEQLRRRRLQVGVGEVRALRLALRAGFGLSSRDELRELCVALWAKSQVEAEIVRAAFARTENLEDWTADADESQNRYRVASGGNSAKASGAPLQSAAEQGDGERVETGVVQGMGKGPGFGRTRATASERGLVLVPQYPLTAREIAQAWRHLRRPVRSGPVTDLDIAATIRERGRHGVATPPVLVPRRRNALRLLMLIDRHGSMTPFHGYVDHVVGAIRDAGRIDEVRQVYFHDLPGTLDDKSALEQMDDPFRVDLDEVLRLIPQLRGGRVYNDSALTNPVRLDAMLRDITPATAILVISDAGAARRQFDVVRLLNSVAMIKALRSGDSRVAWLNPAPSAWWPRTTAEQLQRYVPMFDLSRRGLDQAVDTLKGRPVSVEHLV